MASGFERHAARELLAKADRLGAPITPEARDAIKAIICGQQANAGALAWAEANGGDPQQQVPCCQGTTETGQAADCTCWTPVYELEQQPPQLISNALEALVAPDLCGDCAFRPGSPERSTAWEREALYALADRGEPFWCHRGMQRPVRWEHPDGRTVPGDPADWHPPMVGGIPYQADGSPAVLCGGWAKRLTSGIIRAAGKP